ncbi:Holliday junction resolvase RecU [Candidatus Phytoplasma phoenicium]|uniref:Holliday junction resolvase RecU n=1 Tax=Candidatus Phytoplasma phoenicium TaxID=198422 RepID=A0A0L0MK13_9MOLU|nr:Holliday junction resolvase RecU [Candidatus Phytoplasma phoenicium]KND62591.1 RecU Holliday junction resolvase [Candidatus Phytoplasma phoenicium]
MKYLLKTHNKSSYNLQMKKNTIKSNLGSSLEKDINASNLAYQHQQKALIFKNAVPIQIVKVEYPKRQKAKIVEAYFRLNSLPDYHGIYRQRYLSFDVKEINNINYFPLRNISPHQITYLKQIKNFGGISFFIIHFKKHNEYFYLSIDDLNIYYQEYPKKKSIPYSFMKKHFWNITYGYYPRLDYLKIVDKFI